VNQINEKTRHDRSKPAGTRLEVLADQCRSGLIESEHQDSSVSLENGLAEQVLQESRERHRVLIEGLPIGLFRKDPGLSGSFLLVNEALIQMFGYDSRDEFLAANMADLCENPNEWEEFYGRLIDEGKIVGAEIRFKKKDGTPMWGNLTANVIRDQSSETQYINGLIEDISDRKFLESQLSQALKLEAMGQLAAGIAHEINTPIQYVGDNTRFVQKSFDDLMGLVEEYDRLLHEAGLPPELLEKFKAADEKADLKYLAEETPAAIQQSLEGVGRVAEIVRAMKEFSHPGTVEKVPTDINEAIESTMTLARNEWKYVAEVEMDFDPDLPPVSVLLGDFKQVILNMLINAAHAVADALAERSQEKGRIAVRTRRDGDWAEINIRDTGTGIPPEIRPKIFDLFFTTKDIGKGTGQGLAISRAVVVEKHGGTIDFETEVGKGTNFIIRIPVDPDQSTQRSEPYGLKE